MPLDSTMQLFVEYIRRVYTAENQLIVALPRLAVRATNLPLRHSLLAHLDDTQRQAARLESIAKHLRIRFGALPCHAMSGLLLDGDDLIGGTGDRDTLDLAMLCACRSVEHYEISSYQAALTLAEQLGLSFAVPLLQESMSEESAADRKLEELSEQLQSASDQAPALRAT